MNYIKELYRQMLTSLKRGRSVGGLSKAKPLYLISLIDIIPLNRDNKIFFNRGEVVEFYNKNREIYAPECKTSCEVPFYHLHSEPFYHLVWKEDAVNERINHTPSAKFLRENLLYAKLDDELWELLQEEENREYLKDAIINQYLKN